MVQNSLEQTVMHLWVHLGFANGSSGVGWTYWNLCYAGFFCVHDVF